MADLSLESAYSGPVCGIDEAGRGPLAGPVVAACVYIPDTAHDLSFWGAVNDSKKLTARRRISLFAEIVAQSHYGIAQCTPAEIDELNIHHATLMAMARAYENMSAAFPATKPVVALVDGKFCPRLACPAQPVVKGDSLSISIAAASILAKVTRDRIMQDLHKAYPHYGWDSNAGYPAPVHLAGMKIHGITPHHRRSYAPVRAILSRA